MGYWFDVFRDRKTRKREQHSEAVKNIFEGIEAANKTDEPTVSSHATDEAVEAKKKEDAIGTAIGVASKLDDTRLNFAYWMCALSGILITLGGPTLIKVIQDTEEASSLIPLVWWGILLTGLSLVLGIISCALFYYSTATNPYYHFLHGLGKGSYDKRCSAQRVSLVATMESCHSRSLWLSRWFLLGQAFAFFASVTVVLIGTLAYFKSYW